MSIFYPNAESTINNNQYFIKYDIETFINETSSIPQQIIEQLQIVTGQTT